MKAFLIPFGIVLTLLNLGGLMVDIVPQNPSSIPIDLTFMAIGVAALAAGLLVHR